MDKNTKLQIQRYIEGYEYLLNKNNMLEIELEDKNNYIKELDNIIEEN